MQRESLQRTKLNLQAPHESFLVGRFRRIGEVAANDEPAINLAPRAIVSIV